MKRQLIISVENIENEHCHFKRNIEVDDSIKIPYDSLISSLLWLYQGLNVKVVIQQANI